MSDGNILYFQVLFNVIPAWLVGKSEGRKCHHMLRAYDRMIMFYALSITVYLRLEQIYNHIPEMYVGVIIYPDSNVSTGYVLSTHRKESS